MLLHEAVGGRVSNTKVNQKTKGWIDPAEITNICEIIDLLMYLSQQTTCWDHGKEVTMSGVPKFVSMYYLSEE